MARVYEKVLGSFFFFFVGSAYGAATKARQSPNQSRGEGTKVPLNDREPRVL